jgi:hypothetical protein
MTSSSPQGSNSLAGKAPILFVDQQEYLEAIEEAVSALEKARVTRGNTI